MESMNTQYESRPEGTSTYLVQGMPRPHNPSGFLSSTGQFGWNTGDPCPAPSRIPITTQGSSDSGLPHSESSTAPPKKARAVEVVCGPIKGIFLIDEQAVLLQDKTSGSIKVSPTEMERLGGKESNKKWKSTLRVLDSKGQAGKPVGDWLRRQGIELGVQRKARAKRNRSSLTSVSASHVNLLKEGSTYQSTQKLNESRARVEMDLHLKSCHLGYRPCDPESAELPGCFPVPEKRPDLREVNMNQLSHDQLLVLSHDSGNHEECVNDTLLPNPPGVLVGHEAYVTGREPKRKHLPREHTEGSSLIGDYLSGHLSSPPLEAFGLERLPKLGDRDVDLRELYFLVQESGGLDSTNHGRRWPEIADKMGLNSGLTMSMGYGLRSIYERLLLKFETKEQTLKLKLCGNDLSVNEISCIASDDEINSKVFTQDTKSNNNSSAGTNGESENQACTSREDDDVNDPMFQCGLSGSSMSSPRNCFGQDENHVVDAFF